MTDRHSPADTPPRDRRWTFVAVVLVEAAVIAGLWMFSAHFGG